MSKRKASIVSKRISLSTDERVEKYDVGFDIPQLNKKNIEELKSDIEKDGEIITPITVIYSTIEGKYVILDGWNRFHIAKELNMKCPADLYENLSQEQARDKFLSHNFCQRQMSREVKEQLANDLYTEVSLNFSQIAKLLGVHSCTVSRYINPQEKNQSKD